MNNSMALLSSYFFNQNRLTFLGAEAATPRPLCNAGNMWIKPKLAEFQFLFTQKKKKKGVRPGIF